MPREHLILLDFNHLGRSPAGGDRLLVAPLVLRLGRLRNIDRIGTRERLLKRFVERAVLFLLDPALLVLIVLDLAGRIPIHRALLLAQTGAYQETTLCGDPCSIAGTRAKPSGHAGMRSTGLMVAPLVESCAARLMSASG